MISFFKLKQFKFHKFIPILNFFLGKRDIYFIVRKETMLMHKILKGA